MKASEVQLKTITRYLRRLILKMSTQAGSGHPTSSLSATELMTALLFGGLFRFDIEHPDDPANDRLIFSKGHASPLYYGLWAVAGVLTEEEIMTYRQFGSPLEGHPTPAFPYTEAATGSLGQGLSIGLGMALSSKYLDESDSRSFVLLGDSEMAEGSQWEALQIAECYKLNNLIGILDVNRLGQRGETMYGRDLNAYQRRIASFGWQTRIVDGHSLPGILAAYEWAVAQTDRPTMIIAGTVKGKGVSFLEDQDGWHGKALDEEQLQEALAEIGDSEASLPYCFAKPSRKTGGSPLPLTEIDPPEYEAGKSVATRDAFGHALKRIFPGFPAIVSLDAEVSNSTRAEYFQEAQPKRFFEMYVAEQNMVGAAVGLARRGKIPFVSTFAAFLSRAFDQIRMAQYSDANVKFVGSHAGVAIGQDGPSQMGLEDIALFRTLLDSAVLYPCDAVSTEKLVEQMAQRDGIVYLRTTRGKTPVIYSPETEFPIGGCQVLRQSDVDWVTVVGAGVTLHEALAAYETLKNKGIAVRVIDLYSIKPLDVETLRQAAEETGALLTVEDHYAEGGIGEAVAAALCTHSAPLYSLAVRKKPKSGLPEELLDYEEISAAAIVRRVEQIIA